MTIALEVMEMQVWLIGWSGSKQLISKAVYVTCFDEFSLSPKSLQTLPVFGCKEADFQVKRHSCTRRNDTEGWNTFFLEKD